MLVSGPVSLSRRIFIDRLMVKDYIQWTRQSGQPYSRSLQISLLGRTVLKAPLISIVRKEALQLLASAALTSCVRQVVRSTADYSRSASNCYLLVTCRIIASQAILRAISCLRPFSSTKRRAIRQQDLEEERSALFSLGIITRVAVRKQAGQCPTDRYF